MYKLKALGEITTVHKASSKFESFRTTIPASIVRHWHLKLGDQLDWEWRVLDGQMTLVVSILKKEKSKK